MKPAELAAALGVSTRQVQRLTGAGLPYTPTGVRGKLYDLAECKAWLRNNPTCLSNRAEAAASKSVSASTIDAYTAASRRVHLRVMPSESKPSSSPRSVEAEAP